MLLMPHRLQKIIKKKSTYILYIKNKSIKTMKKKKQEQGIGGGRSPQFWPRGSSSYPIWLARR